ncbi:class I SAM-dependent methyltransferase [Flavitalea flava]
MKLLDKFIQRRRIEMAIRYLPEKGNVLDIGCHKGELFHRLGKRLLYGWGIDPLLSTVTSTSGAMPSDNYALFKGHFPEDWTLPITVDAICMLAVLEHIPSSKQHDIALKCYHLLHKDGRIVITVPSPKTDVLLDILKKLGLINGMSLEEHYGFDPANLPAVFIQAGFSLHVYKKFQLGFNNLFVFTKNKSRKRDETIPSVPELPRVK